MGPGEGVTVQLTEFLGLGGAVGVSLLIMDGDLKMMMMIIIRDDG
jgi:hypothetical protein